MGTNASKEIGERDGETTSQATCEAPPTLHSTSHNHDEQTRRESSPKRPRGESARGSERVYKKPKTSRTDERWKEDICESHHPAEDAIEITPRDDHSAAVLGSSLSSLDSRRRERSETLDAEPTTDSGAVASPHDGESGDWTDDGHQVQAAQGRIKRGDVREKKDCRRRLDQRDSGQTKDCEPLVNMAIERLWGLETDAVYSREALYRSATQFPTIQRLLGQRLFQLNLAEDKIELIAETKSGNRSFDSVMLRQSASQGQWQKGKGLFTERGSNKHGRRQTLKVKKRDLETRLGQGVGKQRSLKGWWKGWSGMLPVEKASK